MLKLATSLIAAMMATVLLANPLSDSLNQRNSLFPFPGNTNTHPNTFRMIPIRLRDNTGLSCPKEGFYKDPRNCSRFYRCVDVASTGYFSIFNFECPTRQVFYEDSNSCVPGICPSGSSKPQSPTPPPINPLPPSETPLLPPPVNPPPPSDNPWAPPPISPSDTAQSPWAPPPISPSDSPQSPWAPPPISPSDTPQLPWAPPPVNNPEETSSPSPPPPPPPPPPIQTTEETSESEQSIQGAQISIPPWFKEAPWWFKTPPAWFHQPPAWFNAPPAASVIIEEDISVGDGQKKPYVTGDIMKTFPQNVSFDGFDHQGNLNDNKTIRIHIPIHIVQQ